MQLTQTCMIWISSFEYDSLISVGCGTSWEAGVRRSKRIKMRPLEYWKGERFLYGRIHESSSSLGTLLYNYIVLVIMQYRAYDSFLFHSCALICVVFFFSLFSLLMLEDGTLLRPIPVAKTS